MVQRFQVGVYQMPHFERQIERNAIEAYVNHNVKVRLPLSARARRELARIRRSVAGLKELQAVSEMHRHPFQSVQSFTEQQLQVATVVRAAQEKLEG